MTQESQSGALADRLLATVPDLRHSYNAELEWWGKEEPGAHIVFGDLLNPYLGTLLMKGEDQQLARVFRFLEELATDNDLDVRSVVGATVCPYLLDDEKRFNRALAYMGPATREFCSAIEARG